MSKTHQETIKKLAIPKIDLKKDDEEPRGETPFQRLMRLYKEKNSVKISKEIDASPVKESGRTI